MAVVAYLRVSTEKQFLENQREEITRFAEKNGMSIDKWYTETVSGSISSKERKLSGLLDKMRPGDSLIVTEISRLSRTLLDLFSSLGHPNFKIGWPYRSNHKVYVVPHPFQVSSPRPAWIEHECS